MFKYRAGHSSRRNEQGGIVLKHEVFKTRGVYSEDVQILIRKNDLEGMSLQKSNEQGWVSPS